VQRIAPYLLAPLAVALLALGLGELGLLSPGVSAGLVGIAGVGLLAVLVAASALPSLQAYGPVHSRGDGAVAQVALSFDDGPDPDSTPQLLAALEAAGCRATFFVLVDRAERHPELLVAMAQRHEIALHGLGHHPGLVFAPPERAAHALRDARRRLQAICGQRLRWYRPPFGVVSPRLALAVEASNLELVWCSLRTLDGVLRSPARLRRVCGRAGPGDIVLMHEGPRAARQVLPLILADLKGRGLQPVAVGDLLKGAAP